jgi:hypothetical protein
MVLEFAAITVIIIVITVMLPQVHDPFIGTFVAAGKLLGMVIAILILWLIWALFFK